MPCRDDMPTEEEETQRQKQNVQKTEYEKRINFLEHKNNVLEAGLCALINQIERDDRIITGDFLIEASNGRLINLVDFWVSHSKSDEARIYDRLYNIFSPDEIDLIKKILKTNETS